MSRSRKRIKLMRILVGIVLISTLLSFVATSIPLLLNTSSNNTKVTNYPKGDYNQPSKAYTSANSSTTTSQSIMFKGNK